MFFIYLHLVYFVAETSRVTETTSRSEISSVNQAPHFTQVLEDRTVSGTHPLKLKCAVIGQPIPEVAWYKDGQRIEEG